VEFKNLTKNNLDFVKKQAAANDTAASPQYRHRRPAEATPFLTDFRTPF
jgi:hypothetical protein